MNNYFNRTFPEAEGMDSAKIWQFLQETQRQGLMLRSFLLLRHGHIVAETAKYPFLPKDKRLVYSCSKTFAGTAVGLAVKEGLLSINDPVLYFFPEYQNLQLDPRVHKMCIKHLLTMSTGHGNDSVGAMCNSNDSWAKVFLETPMSYDPGQKFVYDSGGTYMLSEIITRVTHKPMDEYLNERLFKPLKITDISWDRHGDISAGGWGVLIAPEDLAKLGALYLYNGVFDGQEILPQSWVESATSAQIPTGFSAPGGWSQGYGYQIWKNNQNSFRADGSFGQFCMVFPEEDMIIVTTSEDSNPGRIFPLIEKYLLTDLSPHPYADTIAYGNLKKHMMTWETPVIFPPSESYMEQRINGRSYIGTDNTGQEYNFEFNICSSRMDITINGIQHFQSSSVTYSHSRTNYVIMPPSVSPIIGTEQKNRCWLYSAHHEWINDGTLLLSVCFRETGHIQQWLFVFSDEQLYLFISNSCKKLFGMYPMKSDKNIDFGDMIITAQLKKEKEE